MTSLGAICALAAATAQPAAAMSDYAGYYEGSHTELVAGLELGAEGRFEYGLAYGALNEGAEGIWTIEGDRILLTSDAVAPPGFRLMEQSAGPERNLVVALEVPEGLPVQLFDLNVLFASGAQLDFGFSSSEKRVPFDAGDPPIRVQVSLPVFDIQSQPLSLTETGPTDGYALRFLFEPNDLGKVAFDATPLRIEEGALLLERHERLIRFRRAEP